MSERNAFRAGLILGESENSVSHSGKLPKRNIALQDMTFCQLLRNTIDELQEYVDNHNPNQEQFITHILPDTSSYVVPYSKDEEKQINANREYIQRYVTENDFPEWYNLSVVQRIWKDPIHTPDFDNLDLLLHLGTSHLSAEPVKKDGRLYEYTDKWMEGRAKGFFSSFPANIIETSCRRLTIELLKKQGIQYDGTRFEYNNIADKNGTLDKWRINERKVAYRWMSRQSFCKNPWSDLTREIKKEKPVSKLGWACLGIFTLIGCFISAISFMAGEDNSLFYVLGIISAFATAFGITAVLRGKGSFI